MILFLENGRLGNQLFQYAALKTLFPRERALIFGCSDLFEMFDGVVALRCTRSNSVLRMAQYAADEFFSLRLGNQFQEVRSTHAQEVTAVLEARKGLLPVVSRLSGFFQGERWFSASSIAGLTIRRSLQDAATATLARYAGSRTPLFVHVRLGDYLTWPSPDAPAVLPATWYRECIEELRRRHVDPCFVVLSDDLPAARLMLADVADTCFLPAAAGETFAIMANCQGGVLSASSFSWWAAHFAYRRTPSGSFLAPRHWLGFRSGIWLPTREIESSFLHYVSVDV